MFVDFLCCPASVGTRSSLQRLLEGQNCAAAVQVPSHASYAKLARHGAQHRDKLSHTRYAREHLLCSLPSVCHLYIQALLICSALVHSNWFQFAGLPECTLEKSLDSRTHRTVDALQVRLKPLVLQAAHSTHSTQHQCSRLACGKPAVRSGGLVARPLATVVLTSGDPILPICLYRLLQVRGQSS